MQLLVDHEIDRIFHFAPLHYLPFIARSGELKSKPVLASEGYQSSHFRSTSAHLDQERGFGDFLHLSTVAEPPILAAKLNSGFPHVGIELQTSAYTQTLYDLCRFNIAKTRYLRRNGKPGFKECDANGRYYGNLQIPIARSDNEKDRLLRCRKGDTMIEVLVRERLPLNGTVIVRTYCDADRDAAERVSNEIGAGWTVELLEPPSSYEANDVYAAQVNAFIDRSLADPSWLGNGLEFDRV